MGTLLEHVLFCRSAMSLTCLLTFVRAENVKDSSSNTQNKNVPTQGGRNVPRSVSVVAKSGSSLAKSAPVQIPDPVKRSYSLNFLRERMSDGELPDGRCLVKGASSELYIRRVKMNNLINVVNNLLQCCVAPCQQCCAAPCQQCCAAPCQQLLSTTIVDNCSCLTTIVQSLLTTINKLFPSTIVPSCFNNIVTTIVLCQHRATIDQTTLINIVNSTSVVEP